MRGLDDPLWAATTVQKSTDPFLPHLASARRPIPALTAVRLWREPREPDYAGRYTAVQRTVRVGFSRLIWTRFTSTNRSSAVCAASSSSRS